MLYVNRVYCIVISVVAIRHNMKYNNLKGDPKEFVMKKNK